MTDNCGIDHYEGRYKLGTNWSAWKSQYNLAGPSPLNSPPNYVAGSYLLQYQLIDNSGYLKLCQFTMRVTNPLVSQPGDSLLAPGAPDAREVVTDVAAVNLHCYPNPFGDQLNIAFSLAEQTRVRLSMLDITGREVKVLANTRMGAGIYEMPYYPADLTSGVYFIRLPLNDQVMMDKVVMIK